MGYITPNSMEEAVDWLGRGNIDIIAGGTDFYPMLGERAAPENILDVSQLADLRQIWRLKDGWRIGAAVRWSEIVKADLPPVFDGLKRAAKEVGSWQIQNSGTIAGNLCNASPAADGVPPLLTLNAQVELSSGRGVRVLPLEQFIVGVRQTDLQAGELVSAVIVPDQPHMARAHFEKLGARKYLVISIAMVSAVVWLDDSDRIDGVRVAVGSCSAVATRLAALEAALIGMSESDLGKNPDIWAQSLQDLAPISDIRGSRDFRLEAAQELCKRTVVTAMTSRGF